MDEMSGSCPVAGFSVSSVQSSGPVARELVGPVNEHREVEDISH